mmetsp:Transcript_89354/g.239438  ORF Transcript_89354/g.239438 Transcript_89354/m.239438 type:complete len:367 (+) Transcript_89354:25-1125(+)
MQTAVLWLSAATDVLSLLAAGYIVVLLGNRRSKRSLLMLQVISITVGGATLISAQFASVAAYLAQDRPVLGVCEASRFLQDAMLTTLAATSVHIIVGLAVAMCRAKPWAFQVLRWTLVLLWPTGFAARSVEEEYAPERWSGNFCLPRVTGWSSMATALMMMLSCALGLVYGIAGDLYAVYRRTDAPMRVRVRRVKRAGILVMVALVCFGPLEVYGLVQSLQVYPWIEDVIHISIGSFCWVLLVVIMMTTQFTDGTNCDREVAFQQSVFEVRFLKGGFDAREAAESEIQRAEEDRLRQVFDEFCLTPTLPRASHLDLDPEVGSVESGGLSGLAEEERRRSSLSTCTSWQGCPESAAPLQCFAGPSPG